MDLDDYMAISLANTTRLLKGTTHSNWFGMSGGGWMEVDGMIQMVLHRHPSFPVPAGECRLCYGYNEIQFPLSITTRETNL